MLLAVRETRVVASDHSREALAEYQPAEPGIESTTKKQKQEFGSLQETMGELAFGLGDYGAAVTYFSRAHDAYSITLGWGHPSTTRARTRGTEATKKLAR